MEAQTGFMIKRLVVPGMHSGTGAPHMAFGHIDLGDNQLLAITDGDDPSEIQILLWRHSENTPTDEASGKIIPSGDTEGDILQTLRGHTDMISTLAFAGDGSILVSGSADGSITI